MQLFALLNAVTPTVSPTALPMVESNGPGDWFALAIALLLLGGWLIFLRFKKPQ